MERVCIAIVDASRARLYTFDGFAGPPGSPTQELRARGELASPERRLRPSERFSDTRPGSKSTSDGRGYVVDDGRGAHVRDQDRRFAREVAGALAALVGEHGCQRAIVAASPKMLGNLRRAARLLPAGLRVDEISRDLTHLDGAQLQDHLADLGFLPARERLLTQPPG